MQDQENQEAPVDTQAAAADAAPQLGRLLAEGATTAGHLDAVGQALFMGDDADLAREGRGRGDVEFHDLSVVRW